MNKRNEILFRIFWVLFIIAVALSFFYKPKPMVKTVIQKIVPTPQATPTQVPTPTPVYGRFSPIFPQPTSPVPTPIIIHEEHTTNNTTTETKEAGPSATPAPQPSPTPCMVNLVSLCL